MGYKGLGYRNCFPNKSAYRTKKRLTMSHCYKNGMETSSNGFKDSKRPSKKVKSLAFRLKLKRQTGLIKRELEILQLYSETVQNLMR